MGDIRRAPMSMDAARVRGFRAARFTAGSAVTAASPLPMADPAALREDDSDAGPSLPIGVPVPVDVAGDVPSLDNGDGAGTAMASQGRSCRRLDVPAAVAVVVAAVGVVVAAAAVVAGATSAHAPPPPPVLAPPALATTLANGGAGGHAATAAPTLAAVAGEDPGWSGEPPTSLPIRRVSSPLELAAALAAVLDGGDVTNGASDDADRTTSGPRAAGATLTSTVDGATTVAAALTPP